MKIYPFLVGELEANAGDVFRGGDSRVKVTFPSYSFYIEGASKRIIVDTGFGDPQYCQDHLNYICKRSPGMSLTDFLNKLGVTPESIEVVVLTHCHWDHIGGLDLFPNATVYCQRDEISWAIAPPDWMIGSYPAIFANYLISVHDRLILLDGDTVLERGITMKKVGGHSPGSQIIEVETSQGKVIITGDLIMQYANIERQIPVGSYHNLEQSTCFLQSLRDQLIKDPNIVILPGHDLKVWESYSKGI